ncbi:uncharacterized protein LOC129751229 [Uranotaenia lowii]|uniref:uncharacterized protein LOC129744960 n=1 Tax=Uranotaenia lowii TaxID=190385 RepID=UPI0024798FC6|nr:uncharacterized protein LOC129744960 [Uranotaenia lowii]XP_055593757.1 uncharacterized protein LOC129744961 [Uranotaenia lowii]XP_055601138.1 uncharacterized protein LOC129749986 [Uranotaenia lowii]XP_055602573.1 uncharacterized protein LOC129751229 [Uranotaenia lowii]
MRKNSTPKKSLKEQHIVNVKQNKTHLKEKVQEGLFLFACFFSSNIVQLERTAALETQIQKQTEETTTLTLLATSRLSTKPSRCLVKAEIINNKFQALPGRRKEAC